MEVQNKLKIQSFSLKTKQKFWLCGELTLVPKMCGKLAKRAVCPQIKAEALGPFKHIISSHSQWWGLWGTTSFYLPFMAFWLYALAPVMMKWLLQHYKVIFKDIVFASWNIVCLGWSLLAYHLMTTWWLTSDHLVTTVREFFCPNPQPPPPPTHPIW